MSLQTPRNNKHRGSKLLGNAVFPVDSARISISAVSHAILFVCCIVFGFSLPFTLLPPRLKERRTPVNINIRSHAISKKQPHRIRAERREIEYIKKSEGKVKKVKIYETMWKFILIGIFFLRLLPMSLSIFFVPLSHSRKIARIQ